MAKIYNLEEADRLTQTYVYSDSNVLAVSARIKKVREALMLHGVNSIKKLDKESLQVYCRYVIQVSPAPFKVPFPITEVWAGFILALLIILVTYQILYGS